MRVALAVLVGLLSLLLLFAAPARAADEDVPRPTLTEFQLPGDQRLAFRDGQALLEKGDIAAAVAKLTPVYAALDPNTRAEAKLALGIRLARNHREIGEPVQARALGRTLVTLADQQPDRALLRALARLELAEAQYQLGDESAAVTLWQTARTIMASRETYRSLTVQLSLRLGSAALGRGDFKACVAASRAALQLARRIFNPRLEAEALELLALLYERQNKPADALAWFDRALAKIPAPREGEALKRLDALARADALMHKAEFYWRRYDVRAALATAKQANALYERFNAVSRRHRVWVLLAQMMLEYGRPDIAADNLARGLREARSVRNQSMIAALTLLESTARLRQGDLAGARARIAAATKALGTTGTPALRVAALTAAGDLDQARGEYQGALDARRRACELARKIDDRRSLAFALTARGETYLRLGNRQRAADALSEAVGVAKSTGNRQTWLAAQVRLGSALAESGVRADLARALTIAQAAYATATELAVDRRVGQVLRLRALLYRRLGRPAEALSDLKAALERFAGAEQRERALTLLEIGRAGLAQEGDRKDAAFAALTQALQLGDALGDASLRAQAHAALGDAHQRFGSPEKALQHFTKAAADIERSRATLADAGNKTALLRESRLVYTSLVDLAAKQADGVAPAFAWAERAKARAFLDQLAEARRNIRTGIPQALRQKERALIRRMGLVRARIDTQAADAEAVRTLKAELAGLERDFRALTEKLAAENPRYAELAYPKPVALAALKAKLAPGQLMLCYAVGPRASHAFAVTRDSARYAALPDAATLRRLVSYHRDLIVSGAKLALDEFAWSAAKLGKTLLGPFADLIEKATELIVCADGVLNYLPFETLMLAAPREPQSFAALPYLVRTLDVIRYAPSATVYLTLADRQAPAPGTPPRFVGIGDAVFGGMAGAGVYQRGFQRLPNTRREIEAITALAPQGSAEVALGAKASEAFLKRAAGKASYLHIATHGVLEEARPNFSGLVLSAGGGEDGVCYLVEIFNELRLSADLVVLSACETGLGQLISGEGVQGLTRAFMYAGAPRLIVSLWSVDDASTATLMTEVYRGIWREQRSPARALVLAKRAMLDAEGGRYAHPYFWSPFVLSGR